MEKTFQFVQVLLQSVESTDLFTKVNFPIKFDVSGDFFSLQALLKIKHFVNVEKKTHGKTNRQAHVHFKFDDNDAKSGAVSRFFFGGNPNKSEKKIA